MPTTTVNDTTDFLTNTGAPRPSTPLCEAPDLKRILTDLADQITDADRRHSKALSAMQDRLGTLGSTAQDLRQQAPKEMMPALDRLQTGMAEIADHIAVAGSQKLGTEPTRLEMSQSEAAPALKSALAADALDAFARKAHLARAGANPDFDRFDVIDNLPTVRDDAWDSTSAEALARLYESGDGAAMISGMSPTSSLPSAVLLAPAGALPGIPAGDAATATGVRGPSKDEIATEVVTRQALATDAERKWLEGRFTDIAQRLEQSLTGLTKPAPLEAIDARFTNLEKMIGEAIARAPTRSDLAGLKTIETHVEDLSAQLVTVQTHFSRLDTIELELRSLAERMSAETFAKLFEGSAHKPTDTDALAGAVASRVAKEMPRFEQALQALSDRLSADKIAALVGQSKSDSPDAGAIAKIVAELVGQQMPKAAATQADPTPRLEELRTLIENSSADQRHSEEQINTMLDTMQQAMIRLLDRMDSIEQTRYDDAQSGDQGGYAEQGGYSPAPTTDYAQHSVQSAPKSARTSPSYEADEPRGAPHHVAAERHEEVARPPTHAPNYDTHPQAKPASNREDFIADARRAARKVAEAQPEAVYEPEQEEPGQNKKLRAKAAKKPAGRSLSPVSMALICLLLVGGSFAAVKSTLLAPSAAPQAQPRQPVGNLAPGKTDADKRAQSLDDADLLIEDDVKSKAARNGSDQPGSTQPRRSSLPGDEATRDVREHASVFDGAAASAVPASSLPGLIGSAAMPSQFARTGVADGRTLPAAYSQDTAKGALAAPGANAMPPLTIGPNSLRTSAAKGDPSAEYEIGVRFAEGKGVPQDLQQAVVWYQRSAAQGFAPAQYRLGSMYERGLGLKADAGRARIWYQRAAEQGVVKAMHNLAVLSAGRDNATTDYTAAAKWFQEASEYGLTDSQFNLAIMHDSGLGMERDAKLAYKWFSLAARAGDEEAARRKDSLRAKLSPKELSEGESEIAAWRPKPTEPALNDPRVAGEAWKQRAR